MLSSNLAQICGWGSGLLWSDGCLLSTFTDRIFVDLDLIGKRIDLNPAARLSLLKRARNELQSDQSVSKSVLK